MFSFTDNHKSIKEINTMFSSGNLIVDESYQRRSVWGEKDKIRLIETILINNNPETVSTDYDISDKLFFEPITF